MTKEQAIKILEEQIEQEFSVRTSEAYCMAIEALKQPEPRWIPCSEKLPEYYRDVLITTASDFDDIHKGWRSPRHEWFCDGAFIKESEILAWMPRPKPYRPTH